MQKLPCQSSGETEWSARVARHRRVRALRGESSTGLAVAARVAATELGNDRVSKRKEGVESEEKAELSVNRYSLLATANWSFSGLVTRCQGGQRGTSSRGLSGVILLLGERAGA